MQLHAIPPGLWCVPSAISALTGADIESVIHPALNRHTNSECLTEIVTGVTVEATTKTLKELGYSVRLYKTQASAGPLRAQVKTWAKRSLRWPGRAVLVSTNGHMLVVCDGRVYDSWTPHGPQGSEHPYAKVLVVWAALVDKL